MANLLSIKLKPEENHGFVPDIDLNSRSATSLSSYGSGSLECQSQAELCPETLTNFRLTNSNNNEKLDIENNLSKSEKLSKKGEEKVYKGVKKYGGMILTLLASLCFSLGVLFVKVLKDYGFDAYGVSFWRSIGVTVPIIPVLMYYECGPPHRPKVKDDTDVKKYQEGDHNSTLNETNKSSVFDTVWPPFEDEHWKTWIGLLSRGLIGSTSVILRYYALQYLSIGDTAVITYSTPVLVTIMAHFCLGEKCGIVPVVVAFTTLAGVIIVTKPPILTGAESFDTETLIGTGLACGSLICSSLIVIITRKIREVHFALMTFVFGSIGVAQALILSQTLGHFNLPTGLNDSLLIGGLAILSFIGQMAIILALKFEQAGPVALIRSCDVIFGFFLQFFFLGVVPDAYSSIGAVIVLMGVLITAGRKWLRSLPEEDPRREKWCCLLK